MENKQLQRQLRSIIQSLKSSQITRVVEILQEEQTLFLHKNFTKSGINCTCCTLTHEQLIATGFGRNQEEALINATKNYLQMLVSSNHMIPQLKNALRLREKEPIQIKKQQTPRLSDDTLDLQPPKEIILFESLDDEEPQGCSCIYYEVHQHHLTEAKNMEARMKLIIKQNEILKQLLLKDQHKTGQINEFLHPDKENMQFKANSQA